MQETAEVTLHNKRVLLYLENAFWRNESAVLIWDLENIPKAYYSTSLNLVSGGGPNLLIANQLFKSNLLPFLFTLTLIKLA